MKEFAQWLADTLVAWGPVGLFLISLADSALIPMPQGVDALLIAQAIAAPSTAYLGAALAILGSALGSMFLYFMARKGGKAFLAKKVSPAGFAKMQRQIEEYGALVLVLPTMIPLPLPMKLFVMASGVFQMRLWNFLAAIIFARTVRYGSEAFIAVRYRDQTMAFLRENAVAGAAIGLAVAALFFVVHRWSRRRFSRG